ncbi:MAG: RING finger protein [Planctomycetota bacterium]|jgi:hypothetical protein
MLAASNDWLLYGGGLSFLLVLLLTLAYRIKTIIRRTRLMTAHENLQEALQKYDHRLAEESAIVRYEGVRGVLRVNGLENFTRFVFVGRFPGRMWIFRKPGPPASGLIPGGQEVLLEDQRFDPHFTVKAADIARTRAILTEKRRARLVRMLGGLGAENAPFEVLMVSGRLVLLSRPNALMDRATLHKYLNRALRLANVLSVGEGEMADDTPVPEAHCPVCLISLGGGAVVCTKCEATHHWRCWDFLGACSTLRCGNQTFTMK